MWNVRLRPRYGAPDFRPTSNTRTYFTCSVAMYRFRFAMRSVTIPSLPPLILQKTRPHTGIS
jgi:hypothetical protein